MNNYRNYEKGQILVLLALVLIGLLGFTALAVDGGMIYADRRYMQSAADAASIAGAGKIASEVEDAEMRKGNWDCSALNLAMGSGETTARTKVSDNGFDPTLSGSTDIVDVIVTCNSDLQSVDVQVTITHETNTSFVHLFTNDQMKNTVTSITTVLPGVLGGGGFAIVALRTGPCHSSDVGITVSGTSDITLVDGGIWSNSCMTFNGTPKVHVKKGDPSGPIIADSIVYNDTDVPYHAESESLVVEPDPVHTGAHHGATDGLDISVQCEDKSTDPYENIGQHSDSTPMVLTPGNYGDIKMTKGTITLSGGLYCIDGTVDMNGGTFTIDTTGIPNGVTFYYTGDSFTINGGVHVVLAAPNEDPDVKVENSDGSAIEDLLLYVPESSEAVIKLNGNAGSSIGGTIYAPKSFIDIGGTTSLDTGEEFTINASIIGLDVKVAGVPGLNIRYDEDSDYGTPSSLFVRK